PSPLLNPRSCARPRPGGPRQPPTLRLPQGPPAALPLATASRPGVTPGLRSCGRRGLAGPCRSGKRAPKFAPFGRTATVSRPDPFTNALAAPRRAPGADRAVEFLAAHGDGADVLLPREPTTPASTSLWPGIPCRRAGEPPCSGCAPSSPRLA